MKFDKKVLLVSDNQGQAAQLEGILRIAGYDVVFLQIQAEGDDLYTLLMGTESRFGLLIADVTTSHQNRLIEMCQVGIVDRLLLFQEMSDCTEIYSIRGRVGFLCQSSVLLAAIKELFSSAVARDKKDIAFKQYRVGDRSSR